MARTFDEWSFFNNTVQQGLQEGRYVNAAFTLLAAGPPRLAAGSTTIDANSINPDADWIFPIGVVQNFSVGQNSSVMRLFEIGSERSYFIRGRTIGNLTLGRILYHGPSLLRVLWAYGSGTMAADASSMQSQAFQNLTGASYSGLNATTAANPSSNVHGIKDSYKSPPGEPTGNLWLNLASDVFSQPMGLALFLKDSNADIVGAYYFEYCHVTNHGFGTEAGGTIISENVGISYERMIPIDMNAISLIKDSADLNLGADLVGSAT